MLTPGLICPGLAPAPRPLPVSPPPPAYGRAALVALGTPASRSWSGWGSPRRGERAGPGQAGLSHFEPQFPVPSRVACSELELYLFVKWA